MFSFKKIAVFICLISSLDAKSTTFVIAPVADTLMHSADYYRWLYTGLVSVADIYNNLSLSPHTDHTSCHRYRQLLHGDQIEILDETPFEAHIATEYVRYAKETHRNANDSWILKNNLASPKLAELYQKIIDTPSTSQWVLTSPWHDTKHNITLSIGTRILCDDTQSLNTTLTSYLLCTNPDRIEQIAIPKNSALELIECPENEARTLFVSTLQSFATETQEGVVPLVWGGKSIQKRVRKQERKIALKQISHRFIPEQAWYDENMPQPLSGVDAMGLLLVAARIANIPLIYNNTATLLYLLPEVTHYEDVQEGDILCFPGMAGAITSVSKNTLVMARGYSAKIGHVIECSLGDLCSNAHTFEDLFKLKKEGLPLIVKESLYQDYKILSLSSLFN